VRHGPLPSLFARNAEAEKTHLEQLHSTTHGTAFAVQAKLRWGPPLQLVAPLITAEQAMFVEQTLERTLGIVDFAIGGELGGATVNINGKQPAGARAGAALALIIPLFIPAVVGLFLLVSSIEVSGRLQAAAALGNWTFEADDCNSGQLEGFGGVILKSSKQPRHVVRVVRDPVRGNLVVVALAGKPNHVISSETCPRLVIDVRRGNTKINDVWTQDGNLTLECKELTGAVKFAGCH